MTEFSEKFSVWKSRLLDTSRRNRLLHFTARRGQVTVLAPDADEIFDELVNRGRKLTFVPRRDAPEESAPENTEGSDAPDPRDGAAAVAFKPDVSVEPQTERDNGSSSDSQAVNVPAQGPRTAQAQDDVPIGNFVESSPILDTFEASGPLSPELPVPSSEEGANPSVEPLNGDSSAPVGEMTPSRQRIRELHTGLTATQLATTLYNLRSNARSALEEQGVNVLFLSFGMLHWTDPTTRESVTSPLLLVPVQLERSSVTQPFTLQVRDEDILLNPTLAHKLYIDFRIQLPRLPDEAESLMPGAVFDLVRQSLEHLPAWHIAPEVHLELYSFEKLVMLKDLEAHEEDIAAHPILRALAGDPSQLPPPPTDLLHANELDDKTQPLEVFQVLDADSSQQVAIEWAKRGLSFVIEGPPGTGKSQTIANIIAEVLAQDKKVLFVSAKMAALEVVAKRLAQCGLANFYLEAHSHHTSRGVLVSELGRSLNETYASHVPAVEHLAQLGELRSELNAYARALHTPVAPLDQTPFHAYAVLAACTDAPDLYFEFPDIGALDARQFTALEETLDNLVLHGQVWESQDIHPWRGVALETYTFKARTDIEFRFGELIPVLTRVEAAGAKLGEALTLPAPQSLQGVERLMAIAAHALETPAPPTAWFRPGETAELRAPALDAQRLDNAYAALYAEYSAQFSDTLLERTDVTDLVARLKQAQEKPLRILDAQYRRDIQVVRSASKTNQAVHVEQAIDALEQVQDLLALRAQREAQRPNLAERFGRLFNEQGTDWDAVLKQLAWVDQMIALFAPETVPESFTNLVCNRLPRVNATRPLFQELQEILARGKAEWDFLVQLFPVESNALFAEPFTSVRGWLGERLDRVGELEAWLEFKYECGELERLGAGSYLESARASKLQGDQLKPSFLKRFYPLWLDAVYAQFPVLAQSDEIYRKRVAQFWRADVEQLSIARERLAQQLAQARPAAGWSDAPSSEVTLLKREMVKRKHHKSIRRLASEIPNLLLALKPCLMMSPLSVSQYLANAPVIFDLVLFDEASQIPPEETVAAIVRAKQIIVAGDHQQLPPTPFFQTLGELEEEEWQDTNVMESLLQEAAIVLPSVRLMWHYRSRHEALLGFSNHYFYEDRLVTFPNASVENDRLGVEFIHVPEGVYDRAKTRTNLIEAQRVADLVLEHFTHSPGRSLGVVTFSQAQRAAIDLELQHRLRERPELETYLNGKGNEPFFCKSLENVQGDERDVMFFSVGYGKDANGVLTLNFGPLNGQDGARRLNVAITRAREQVKLVSSFLPADLDTTRTNSKGVQLLRAYMDYTARHGQAGWIVAAQDETRLNADEQDLRVQVQEALAGQGFDVRTGIGAGSERIDLALVEEGEAADSPAGAEGASENTVPETEPAAGGSRTKSVRYALGIELEGEAYHHAHTARERERLRVQVLEQLGWKIYHLRARDWVKNPAQQLERITQLLSALDTPADAWVRTRAERSGVRSVQNAERAQAAANGSDTDAGTLVPTGMAVYVSVPLPRQGTPEQFFRAEERTLQDLFVLLAEQEGPLHWNAAARRIAACWGIARVTPAVEDHLDGVLSTLVSQQRILLRDDFLWSPVTMDVLVRQPAPGQEPRPIEEIALEEIARAAYLNLKNALSLTEEDWIALTARLLGYPRASERVKRRIQAAMAKLETGEIVKREDGKVELK